MTIRAASRRLKNLKDQKIRPKKRLDRRRRSGIMLLRPSLYIKD